MLFLVLALQYVAFISPGFAGGEVGFALTGELLGPWMAMDGPGVFIKPGHFPICRSVMLFLYVFYRVGTEISPM